MLLPRDHRGGSRPGSAFFAFFFAVFAPLREVCCSSLPPAQACELGGVLQVDGRCATKLLQVDVPRSCRLMETLQVDVAAQTGVAGWRAEELQVACGPPGEDHY